MRINDLNYRVAWKRFKKGTSFFVPCIRLEEGKESVKTVAKRLGYRVAIKVVIEDGIKGLRVWRIK
jgi:acetyl/propionyl-CoA carboxylase alpha subunit